MANTGAVEVYLDWGGDFVIDATGDLVLAQDTLSSPQATTQRLIRLLLTSPRLKDNFGHVLSRGDDYFHPDWGAGLQASVDGAFSQENLQAMQSTIISQLMADPAVSSEPPPNVTVTQVAYETALVNVSYTNVNGQVQALPTLKLSPQGT